jgi:multidrug efflux pump subunit AcrA (membrane-fusion protein)
VIGPEQAITRRNERTGVFVVAADSQSVTWREVRTGIRDGERVQVHGDDLTGRVVILGQQLLDNGSLITIPDQESRISSAPEEVAAQ